MSSNDKRQVGDIDDYSSRRSRGGNHSNDASPRASRHDRESLHKHDSRGFDDERSKTRSGDRDRRKDGESRHRDYDYDRHSRSHERDRDRRRDYDNDRERRSRHKPSSTAKDKSRDRSRSRSRSPSKSKRRSGFDMAPSATLPPGAAITGQVPAPQSTPGMVQNTLPFGTTQLGALPLMPLQAMTQQATRHARRVYVGGLPPTANEQGIATFFSHVMASIGGNSAGPGDAVVNVYINQEKKFAFVEMRTVEEASNAMALDGIIFEGVNVRVRRPTDYNPSLAATLGPSQPSPHLNLAAIGLTPASIAGAAEGPDRIFVGGLPYYFTEAQIRELLESFGPLSGFDLVKDRDTGNSKGYGFCVYKDPAVTDIACAALNGLKMGDKTLTVRRATASGQSKSEHEYVLAQAQQHIAMQKMALQAGGIDLPGVEVPMLLSGNTSTKVLCLTEAITADILKDDEEYQEILEDMHEECGKFGTLINVVIPRPSLTGEQMSGIGKIFLEYSDKTGCTNARSALNGRRFGGNVVSAFYYSEEKYYSGDFGG